MLLGGREENGERSSFVRGIQELGIQASGPFPECTSSWSHEPGVQGSSRLSGWSELPHAQPWPTSASSANTRSLVPYSCRALPAPSPPGSPARMPFSLAIHWATPTHVQLSLIVSPLHSLPWGTQVALLSVIRTLCPIATFYLRDYFIDLCLPERLGAFWGQELSLDLVIAVPQHLAQCLGWSRFSRNTH